MDILTKENICLNCSFENKWNAIEKCGEILYKNGYVQESYIDEMIQREKSASVYIGNGVAIPHGINTSSESINFSGLSVIQIPSGVDFDGQTAYLLIGIAGKGKEHIKLLSEVALNLTDENKIKNLINTNSKSEILNILC